jgi:hypothetical protein
VPAGAPFRACIRGAALLQRCELRVVLLVGGDEDHGGVDVE